MKSTWTSTEYEWRCEAEGRWCHRSECFIWYADGNNPNKPGHEVKPGHEKCGERKLMVTRQLAEMAE